ncbi:hypothetical protein PR202_ga04557 [Eleusine coracana subsp. coracana]|uniref:DUF630 domain-containing protein n=1 Tax=Eleusine coracana subsp. coracana TaxID=191504 RepID=A0AAV5BPX4_ELECO|nr:hypothetical protein PR202_ga04557 [Eleusine coracana subsp. coracana]
MGCAQSRIENEEAVARCKERRQWMKAAVAARNAFAAAHSAYAFSLRDTGAAPLGVRARGGRAAADAAGGGGGGGARWGRRVGRDGRGCCGGGSRGRIGGGGRAHNAAAAAAGFAPPSAAPLFSPSPPAKIHRSISMPMPPSTAAKGPSVLHSDSIREEDVEDVEKEEEEEEDGQLEVRRRRLRHQPPMQPPVSPPPPETPVTPQPPPPPPPEPKSGIDTWDYFFSMDEGMASIGPDDDEIIPEPEGEKYAPPSPPRPPPSPPPPAPVPLSEEFDEEPRTPEMVPPTSTLPPKPPKHSSKKKKGKGKMKAAHHQHTESAPPITLVGGGKAGKVAPALKCRVYRVTSFGFLQKSMRGS